MKKKMIALLAGVLLTLGASNAMAYFEDYELVRVVYNTSTNNETVTDLGNVNSLIGSAHSSGSLTVGGGTDAFTNFAGMGSAQNANLMVGYLVVNTGTDSTIGNQLWFSGSNSATSSPAYTAQFPNVHNGMTSAFMFNFGALANGYTMTDNTADSGSYYANFSANAQGTMGNFLQTVGGGEASLANLASTAVQQGLFYWADGTTQVNGTKLDLTILTNADGSTTLQAAQATPVPAAAWLLGSGLMGLFGLRRKQSA